MDFLQPVITNWFTILSALGIAGGLFFDGYALRSDTKTRRVANRKRHTRHRWSRGSIDVIAWGL